MAKQDLVIKANTQQFEQATQAIQIELLKMEVAALRAERDTLRTALNATLPELAELENHWKNEAESFDHPLEVAERGMALTNLESTRRVISRARAALK